jgi:hypothetical protein
MCHCGGTGTTPQARFHEVDARGSAREQNQETLMTLTHAKLLDAVRAAGRDRASFTCADVRQQLGLSTHDKKQLNRFYSLFRALQKDAANEVEKLANNSYRLRAAAAPASSPAAEPLQVQSEDPALPRLDDTLEVVSGELQVVSGAELAEVAAPPEQASQLAQVLQVSAESSEPEVAPPALLEPIVAELVHEAPVAVAPASKPRPQWLTRMARFFGRRPSAKNDAAASVAVGA